MKTHLDDEERAASLPLDEPELIDSVERALEPLKAIFPKAMIKSFRRAMLVQLAANAEAIALVRNIHRTGVAKSTELVVATPPEEELSHALSRPASGDTKGTPQ
jgi:Tfp pilus assembly protein PilO